MKKFYCVNKDLLNYYNDDIALAKVSCLIDTHYLKYKEDHNEPVLEANGSHIMYVVEKAKEFETNCKNNNIDFMELPIDEAEYNLIYKLMFNKTHSLNEDLHNSFDNLEDFVSMIAKNNDKLIVTDQYAFRLTSVQVYKLSNWMKNYNMFDIEFVLPASCHTAMASIISDFASNGITASLKAQKVHGRYWIVDNQGFIVDASVNATTPFYIEVLSESDVNAIKVAYSL